MISRHLTSSASLLKKGDFPENWHSIRCVALCYYFSINISPFEPLDLCIWSFGSYFRTLAVIFVLVVAFLPHNYLKERKCALHRLCVCMRVCMYVCVTVWTLKKKSVCVNMCMHTKHVVNQIILLNLMLSVDNCNTTVSCPQPLTVI